MNDLPVDLLTTMNLHRPRATFALLALALALAACNSAEGPPVPGGLSSVSGNSQFAVVGSPAANPLVVLVTDQNGSPLANTPVSWTVTGGGGTVADTASTSDASGLAMMTYTAGPRAGAATVVATVGQFWTTSFTIYIEAP